MTRDGPLVLMAALRAKHYPDQHKIRVTSKFLEGVIQYLEVWPRRIEVIMRPDREDASGNLDDVLVDPRELPFGLTLSPFDKRCIAPIIRDSSVVQGGSGVPELAFLPILCRDMGIAHVFVSEYTLSTRLQIIAAETKNPLLRLRRACWEWSQERLYRRGVVESAAVQCNGTPTFDAYSPLNKNTLLYFDSRISKGMIPDSPNAYVGVKRIQAGEPIRLAFSGRLDRMKGVDDLIVVAEKLRELEVPFTLDICGDGELASHLRDAISEKGLGDLVRLRGILDFKTELIPFVTENIDLFVCCHKQGDPSCTYLETLACGVPIVGYANEAWAGILARHNVGWAVPMHDTQSMAARIKAISDAPLTLIPTAECALRVARQHTFEDTINLRVQHMLDAVKG